MYKATFTVSLAVVAAALLASTRAEAGASASAASKYGHSSQVTSVTQVRTTRQARRPEIGITEYSSSSRPPSHGRAYR